MVSSISLVGVALTDFLISVHNQNFVAVLRLAVFLLSLAIALIILVITAMQELALAAIEWEHVQKEFGSFTRTLIITRTLRKSH